MVRIKMLVAAAAAVMLTLGLAGMASAAAITCGDCHSAPPVNGDNCTNTARGLHGTHYNYSSATFKKTVASYGKCAYCHPSTTSTAPTVTHNNNYTNITGNASGGKAVGLKENADKTCTNACHKKNSTGKWGNYTATTVGGVKLGCNSCHDDYTNKAGLSGAHSGHLNSAANVGAYPLNGANNVGCQNCHPDNQNDLWKNGKADDGTKKAYPHALDGTNVVADNSDMAGALVTSASKAGLNTTCANTCHPRSNTGKKYQATWGTALGCQMCHYYQASPTMLNNSGTGSLGGAHSIHFNKNKVCNDCHPTATDGTHAAALPIVAANATVTRTGMSYATQACTFTSNGVGCHGNTGTTPGWYTTGNGCSTCHAYPGATTDWTGTNGHVVKYATSAATNTHLRDNASYNKTTDTVDAVCADVNKCGRCHNGVTEASGHNNGTVNAVASGAGDCSANFTFNVATTGKRVTCSNVSCHSGKKTPNWW